MCRRTAYIYILYNNIYTRCCNSYTTRGWRPAAKYFTNTTFPWFLRTAVDCTIIRIQITRVHNGVVPMHHRHCAVSIKRVFNVYGAHDLSVWLMNGHMHAHLYIHLNIYFIHFFLGFSPPAKQSGRAAVAMTNAVQRPVTIGVRDLGAYNTSRFNKNPSVYWIRVTKRPRNAYWFALVREVVAVYTCTIYIYIIYVLYSHIDRYII